MRVLSFLVLGWLPWIGWLAGYWAGRRARRATPITDKQRAYIKRLCAEAGREVPDLGKTTVGEASRMIDDLKGGR